MIEAVPSMQNPFSNNMAPYANHFSFIQSADNHGSFVSGEPADLEEVRAIQDEAVFTRGLVSPRLQTLEDEEVRGKKITFSLNLGFRTVSYDWWIWKRTYHRLRDWQSMHASDYVYDFVLKP